MSNNTEEISHELNSERARRYSERQKAVESFLNGTADAHANKQGDCDDISIAEFNANDMNAAAGTPTQATVVEGEPEEKAPAAVAAPVQPASGDSIIRIRDMKAPVSLSCTFVGKQGRKKTFAIRLNAISVDVSDNGISLMLSDAVAVEPPITEQMKLTYKGKHYRVIFAGGMHRFGPFVNMYFTRLIDEEDQPTTEQKD